MVRHYEANFHLYFMLYQARILPSGLADQRTTICSREGKKLFYNKL